MLQQRGEPELTNFEWPRQKLFKPLSMTSALVEAQSNQYLLGGSNAYMTSRDWTRLGQLYINDGVWVDGTRFFPEGWVDYSFTVSPTSGSYAKVRVPAFGPSSSHVRMLIRTRMNP